MEYELAAICHKAERRIHWKPVALNSRFTASTRRPACNGGDIVLDKIK
jgi:hypothetical protein